MKILLTDPAEDVSLLPWQRVHEGLRWRDMPGADEVLKKMNFFFFRRGLLQRDENGEWVSVETGQLMHRGRNRRRGRRWVAVNGSDGSKGTDVCQVEALAMVPPAATKMQEKQEKQEKPMTKKSMNENVKGLPGRGAPGRRRKARQERERVVDGSFFGGDYGWLDDPMSVGKRTSCRLSAEQGEALIERLGAARVTAGVIWRDVASATGVSSSQLSRLRQFPEGMAARPVARLLAWCDSVDGLRGFAGAPVEVEEPPVERGGEPGRFMAMANEMLDEAATEQDAEGGEEQRRPVDEAEADEGREGDAPARGGTLVGRPLGVTAAELSRFCAVFRRLAPGLIGMDRLAEECGMKPSDVGRIVRRMDGLKVDGVWVRAVDLGRELRVWLWTESDPGPIEGQEDGYVKFEEGRKDDAPARAGTVVAVDVQGESVKSVVVPRRPVPEWPVVYHDVTPVWLDLETGGLDCERNPIVEMAAYQGGLWFWRPVDWRAECQGHGLDVDAKALQVNGAAGSDWPGPDSPKPVPVLRALLLLASQVLGEDHFQDWLAGEVRRPLFVCGANPQFDVDFLNASCRRHGLPELARRGLDVQQEAMAMLWAGWSSTGVPSFSSDNLAEALGMLPEARPHRAMAGVKQAMALHAEIRRRAGLPV